MSMLCAMVVSVVVSIAGSAEISQCTWSSGKLHVSWTSGGPADYYEVQVANAAGGPIFAVFSTKQTSAELDFLVAKTSYWLKVRAHQDGMPSLGPGTWLEPGSEVECKTGSRVSTRVDARAGPAQTKFLEVLRQSEYTYDVDYLMNHNSGDLMGDTAFLVQTQNAPSFLNVTFPKSVFTLYCVEMLVVSVPHTITTDGDGRFADYLSCNDNHNATDPRCSCDNYIDRVISRKSNNDTNLTKYCHNSVGGPCSSFPGKGDDCTCDCTNASLVASAKYTGMMPVSFSQAEPLGYWYSHPKDTECKESEVLGVVRADGTSCTWKRRPEARLVRGADAIDFGWNKTGNFSSVDPDLIRQNAAVMRKLFDSKPFQQWSCGDRSTTVPAALLV